MISDGSRSQGLVKAIARSVKATPLGRSDGQEMVSTTLPVA